MEDRGCSPLRRGRDKHTNTTGEVHISHHLHCACPYFIFRNIRLLSRLPTPLVSLASHQLAGRGRGSNVWLSPSGSLSFSTLLRVSLSLLPASKLVFVQYLFALAVVEACRDSNVLGSWGGCTRLKWPNDLYATLGPEERNMKKIGGILVNTSFSGGNVDIIIGKSYSEYIIQTGLMERYRMRSKCAQRGTSNFTCAPSASRRTEHCESGAHRDNYHCKIREDVVDLCEGAWVL